MTTEQARALAYDMDVLLMNYGAAEQEYLRASKALRDHIQILRAAMIELTRDIEIDGIEASMRTIVAMHRGNGDSAAALARASVRCARAVSETETVLYGSGLLEKEPPQ